MITPAYAPTATERVLPRLALDFTTGTLDPRVTVTRALNTATRVNSSGLIEIVNANLPRFDYDPVTLAPKGLLIEETRSNICIQSEDFGTSWTPNSVGVSTNSTVSPSGLSNADTITASAGSAQHRLIGTQGTVTSGVSITHSFYVKSLTHNFVQIHDTGTGTYYANFDLSNGTVTAVSPANGASISSVGNGWYRCTLTLTTATTVSGAAIAIIPNGSAARNPTWAAAGTESVYAWGYQIETGAFPTSYIPTTTTSVTRNADAVSMTGTNFSSWYNASESTIVATGSFFALGNNTSPYRNALVGFSDGTSANAVQMGKSVAGFAADRPATYSTNGSFGQSIAGVPITASSIVTMALGLKTNSVFFAANGVAGVEDTTSSVPPANQLGIGSFDALGPSSLLNGYVRAVRYYPLRLTNAEIQAFSKG